MLTQLSSLIADLVRGRKGPPDPDGAEIARRLFEQPDPIEIMAPLRRGVVLGGPSSVGEESWESRAARRRAEIAASTDLVFVAAPETMRKMRAAGVILKLPSGSEVAVHGGRQIPFGGYVDDVAFDDLRWGAELRRRGPAEQAALMARALREADAERFDAGEARPAISARSKPPRI